MIFSAFHNNLLLQFKRRQKTKIIINLHKKKIKAKIRYILIIEARTPLETSPPPEKEFAPPEKFLIEKKKQGSYNFFVLKPEIHVTPSAPKNSGAPLISI